MQDVVETALNETTQRDDLKDLYPILAKNFLELSGSQVLFTTLKAVPLSVFTEGLDEAEKAYWSCNTCVNFFDSYMNVVYYDQTTEKFESALMPLHLITADTVPAQWQPHLKAVRDKVLSAPAGALFEPSVIKAISGKDREARKYTRTQDFSAARTVLGRPTAGGYDHFHAEYLTTNPTTALGVHWKQTIESIETLVGGVPPREIAKDMRTYAELIEHVKGGRFYQQLMQLATMLDVLATHTVPGYHMTPYIRMMAETATNEQVAAGWNLMGSFNGSALGNTFRVGMADGNWDYAAREFIRQTDPALYRAKDTAKVVAKDIDAARAAIESAGVTSALVRRFAAVGDIIGESSVYVRPEKEAEKPSTDPFEMAKAAIEGKAKEELVINSNVEQISWETFMGTVLKEFSDIEIAIAGSGAYYYFTVPTDAEAKPIFGWDKPESRIPWCTIVSQQPTLPQQHGVSAGWHPLQQVLKSPMGNYHLVCVVSMLEKQESLAASFGSVLQGDLYQHRAAIDLVLETVGTQSVKYPLIGIRQGAQGCRLLDVRGKRNGVLKHFRVINLG